jgi:hypothetical protein
VLTYILEVIQQPERARAYGTGAKSSTDRRPVDPPPVVRLSIFELRNGVQTDVSFSYDASFFIFASLEVAQAVGPGRPHLDKNNFFNPATVLTGRRVAGAAYLDRPYEALYFIFPDLSVRHEGKYKLCFNLYETTKHLEDHDISEPGGDLFVVSEHPSNPVYPTEDCHWRMDIKSANFTVYSAKKYPGLAEGTVLTRTVAEQGCLMTRRRDVRMRRRKPRSMEDEGGLSPPYEREFPAPTGETHKNDTPITKTIPIYPDILDKELAQSQDVHHQHNPESSGQLSYPQTTFTSIEERKPDHSAELEETHASDEARPKESLVGYSLLSMNFDIPSQDHGRDHRQYTQKESALSGNDRKWEVLKQDIYRLYITEDNSFRRTMLRIEEAHGLKAS